MNRTTRREFVAGAFAAGATAGRGQPALPADATHDDNLTLFLADAHIRGDKPWYSEGLFKALVAEVLAHRPLPRRCVVLGDVAYLFGRAKDYELAAALFKPLEDAGIELTLGMGNHDRRETFFERFPRYVTATKVPGRVVMEVPLNGVDLLMLDSLRHPDEGKGVVPGEVGGGQMEWLVEYLKKRTRPVIVCAHHPSHEIKEIVGPLEANPCVVGYVYGHYHHWENGWTSYNSRKRAVRTCGLPSASLWGDIGYAYMRTLPGRAELTLVQRDYVVCDFRDKTPVRPPDRAAAIQALLDDRSVGLKCTFPLS